MAIKNGIVTSGLTFMYDMDNERSFKGKPTTNYAHNANPERFGANPLQGDTWSATGSGTWNARHQDAIRVFSHAGSELTSHINTGVVDWTNTYHGIWTFDEELGYPVSTMRDIGNGAWMFAGFGFDGTINTPAKLGLTTGSNYVISWDQWTTNTSKSANCGLYGQNATNTGNGFHDGLSNQAGASAFNTKTHTWQRLYAIFTVSSNRGLNATWSQYNYGHYGGRGVTKVANFQLETGNIPSKFLYSTSTVVTDSRSTSQAIVDIAGGHTITANSLTYDATDENKFSFTDSGSYLSIANGALSEQASSGVWTIDLWLKRTTTNSIDSFLQTGPQNNFLWLIRNSTGQIQLENVGNTTGAWSYTLTNSEYFHLCATGTGGTATLYINGVSLGAQSLGSTTFSITSTIGIVMGQEMDANNGGFSPTQRFIGEIPSVKFYNRVLTASEVKQNYNASKSKYV